MEWKKLGKDALYLAGIFATNLAMHKLTAYEAVRTRRFVSVTSLSDHELEIEDKGKKEVLPLTVKNSSHLAVIWDSLKTGKKIHMILKCLVTKHPTRPALWKAEIIEVCHAK